MSVLRQKKPITKSEQIKYFHESVFTQYNSKKPNQLLFILLENDNQIGYGGLVNISWEDKRAEMSILVESGRASDTTVYEQDLYSFCNLLKEVSFSRLNLNRLFVETYEFRKFHISVLEKIGFKLEGRMKEQIYQEGQFYDSLIHGLLNPNTSHR